MSKKLTVRPYERDRDYPIVCRWWEKHGLSVIPYLFLPIGFLVSVGDKDIAAGWVHMDKNSPMCWMNWLVTNPSASAKDKYAGFNAVIENLKGVGFTISSGNQAHLAFTNLGECLFLAVYFNDPTLSKQTRIALLD